MNRVLPGAVGVSMLLILSPLANAADLALKAPPPPALSWTGWYVGGTAGATINDSSYALDPAGCFIIGTGCGTGGLAGNPYRSYSAHLTDAAFTGGGQIGFNWQVAPSVVIGLETDFNFTGIDKSDLVTQTLGPPIFAPGSFVHVVSDRPDWFGTVRPRLGVLATPNLMFFGTGGFAYGHIMSSEIATFPPPGASDTYIGQNGPVRVGWTAGGGLEYMVTSAWSVKVEYLYVDLGSFSYAGPCVSPGFICGIPSPPAYQTTVTTRENVVRAGLDFQLGPTPNFGFH